MDILKRIEENVAVQGSKTAFKSRTGEITYGELWEKSGRLASEISRIMQGNKKPVIVYGHKDPLMIVCFIACVRSGRAYCPVDISMPIERIRQISDKIGNPLVLSVAGSEKDEGNDEHELFNEECTVLNRETIYSITDNAIKVSDLHPCKGEDDFYIIFTSGTTGKPKGVRITADNLNNYLKWAACIDGGIEKGAVFLNQAPYSFDLSVMDLYLSLYTSGTVVSVDNELQKDQKALNSYLQKNNIDYWVSTPSFADLCLADESFDEKVMPGIKSFLFCGEPLSCETALKLMKRFPGGRIINTYGPTESTVCITEICITEKMAQENKSLPVGKVKDGTTVITDSETSEIIIMGDTVSPGYYNEPELTSQHFFTDFQTEENSDSHLCFGSYERRAYRTGDKGHYDEEGNLYCDGRIDNQIKLHGYRLEIEDIEANLEKINGVIRAAVSVRVHDGKADSLTAFIIRDSSIIPDAYPGRRAVRKEARMLMPDYMVPKRIVFVDRLPVTNNGKLDRKKLKEMV